MKGRYGKEFKDQSKNELVAYTPLTAAQKKLKMEELIKDLHSGKRGGYRSPGSAHYSPDRLEKLP